MIITFRKIYLLAFIALFNACQEKESKVADRIISNATIWTGNDLQATAQAMAIAGDSILAIGSLVDMQSYKGEQTEVINMKGQFITPGFIDCHVHLMMGGNALLSVELRDASTPEEFTKRIADYAKTIEPGDWILEGNWDHTLWGGELPKKEWIDAYTKDNPVVLYRLDGHMVLANSAALKMAGIDENTPAIESGKIIKDAKGFPTGILKGNAMNPVLDAITPMTPEKKEAALTAAMNYFLANGVTSVHDVDSLGTYEVANKFYKAGKLAVRIYTIDPIYNWEKIKDTKRVDNKFLKRGGLKGFVDGSLGSHTAAFHRGYTDQPKDKGFFINSRENLYQWINGADKTDAQIMVHAIGDDAIHSLLNIYDRILEENGKKDRRFRIEHVQHIAPEDIPRLGKLNIIASMQPYHAIDDGRWAEELIGAERIKTTYAFKSLLDANTTLAFGSDWPVAPAQPLYGIYAAVTRRTLDDKNPDGWVPAQKINVEEALKAYTKNAAYASFEENIKGTLEVGKLADFVVLEKDIRKIDAATIRDVKVLQTYVGGKKVFELGQK